MDFTPREKTTPVMTKGQKKKQSMAKKKGTIIGFDEEEDDENFDEFLADFEKKKKEKEDNEMTDLKIHEMEKSNLEVEIKTLIKQKDTQSPDSSQHSRSSSMRGRKMRGAAKRR